MDTPETEKSNIIVDALKLLAASAGTTPQGFIGGMIGEIIRPVIKQEIDDALARFKNTAEIGGQNADLQNLWNVDSHSSD